jgi:hypothetical protein
LQKNYTAEGQTCQMKSSPGCALRGGDWQAECSFLVTAQVANAKALSPAFRRERFFGACWLRVRDSITKSFLLLFFKKEDLLYSMRNVLENFLTEQRGRFVLFLPVFSGTGILGYFALKEEPPFLPALLVAALACGSTALAWRRPFARGAFLCLAFAALGFALACAKTFWAPGWVALPRTATEVVGRVSEVEALPAGRRVTIDAPALDGALPMKRRWRRGIF